MYVKTRPKSGFVAIAALVLAVACSMGLPAFSEPAWAQMLEADSGYSISTGPETLARGVASGISCQEASIDQVRAMIEGLPAASDVTLADGDRIAQAREAFDALSPAEQELLDTETNREVLGTTQSYGRVLELAEAGYAVLFEVDNSTSLADGAYITSVTTEWNRGKSASKQDRNWVAKRVDVQDGKAYVTLGVNSSTYSYLRASGVAALRLATSGADESLFMFPVALNTPMVFCAYSELMAAEIAYNLKVSVPKGAQPELEPGDGEGEGGDDGPVPVEEETPICTTDPATGAVVVERGLFAHPEVKSSISTMFRIVAPALISSDGRAMTVYAEMPSTSYTHLFVGTAEQADGKSLQDGVADGSFIPAQLVTNSEGKEASAFTFPLASLDEDLAVCLYSKKNEHWVNHVIRFDSAQLTWHATEERAAQLQAAIDKLEALPARNTIVPDNPDHEAIVHEAREAYDALDRLQKAQVPRRLTLLLEWDESMFELGFNTEQLPLALVGQPYDGAIYVSGKNGEAGKTARVVDGALPEGMAVSLDGAEGRWVSFVGTPSQVGSSTFTVELSNGVETASKQFTIHVGYAPRILTGAVDAAASGVAYEQVFEADAYPDATWSLADGKLPAGLSFADDGAGANTARILGTPTEAGTFTFTLACDNFANGMQTATYTLQVFPSESDKQVAKLAESLEEALAELAGMKGEIADLKQIASQFQVSIDQLKDEKAQLEKTGNDLKAANDQLRQKNDQLSKKVKDLSKTVADLKTYESKKVTLNVKTVTAKALKAALKKARNPYAKSITLGAKVTRIKAGAFASTDVRTIVVKSTKLTKKGVKGSLKGSHVKTLKVPKAKKAAYRKAFAKANSGRKVTVK